MTKELTAEDYLRTLPPVEIGGDTAIETIPVMRMDEVALEAFMQEPVTIVVHDSTDNNAVPRVEVSVNGRRILLRRNTPTVVKRMYVERLAHAQKTTISQNLDPRLGEEMNMLTRRTALDYPFAVIEDKNPKGAQWLKDLLGQV